MPVGTYFFGNLSPGDYRVRIPESNFTGAGALTPSLTSSTDIATSLADNEEENDDNGQQMASGEEVISPIINLFPATEPLDAVEDGPGGQQDAAFDASGDMTVDFGFLPNVAIGSTVFFDIDNDALFEPADGENGIDGVTVQLFFDANVNGIIDGTEGDAPLATTTTMNGGQYLFENLAPGNYQVVLPASNFVAGTGVLDTALLSSNDAIDVNTDAGLANVDNDDNGDQPGGFGTTVLSPVVSLTPGQETTAEPGVGGDQDDAFDVSGDMTIDFGFAPNVSIGSTVFIDVNNNATLDATEAPVEGVVVELYFDADGDGQLLGAETTPVANQPTDAAGNYFFDNLPPGNYQVQIPASNFTGAGVLTGSLTSSTDIATSTADNQTDNDDNGQQLGGPSTVVSSPFITLYPGSEPTDGTGDGDEMNSGAMLDNNRDASGDMTVDFGFLPNVAVGSQVFFDVENNAEFDAGIDSGIDEVVVQLLYDADNNGVLEGSELMPFQTTTTMNGGLYLFDNLTPGNYQVVIPATNFNGGALDTTLASSNEMLDVNLDNETEGDDNGDQPGGFGTAVSSPLLSLLSGTEPAGEAGPGGDQDAAFDVSGDMTVDFGFAPNVSIGSTVFADPNNSGTRDPAEPGLPGVPVELLFDANGNGLIDAAEEPPVRDMLTDGDGNYYFDNLPPGNYVVQIPAPSFGDDQGLAQFFTSSDDLPSSSTDSEVEDDDNGLQPGGPGTTVRSPVIELFAGSEPTGTEENGPGGDQDDIFDSSGDMTIDFGFQPNVAIGSTVFFDINNNGLQDAGENGLANVEVELYWDRDRDGQLTGTETTPIRTLMTDQDGNYLFAILVPGVYQIQLPESNYAGGAALDSLPNSSTDIATTAADNERDGDDNGLQMVSGGRVISPFITLMSGTEPGNNVETEQGGLQDDEFEFSGDMTVDFGFIPNVSIGSNVFVDLNDNNLRDPGEPGIPGVLVQLYYDADGNGRIDADEETVIASTTTDAEGNYEFTNLPPGNYRVDVPVSNFAGAAALEFTPTTSTPVDGQTNGDNQLDQDNNGTQTGGPRGVVQSPLITLLPGREPTGTGETGGGNGQDDRFDNAGDMTVDFGFVCNLEVIGTQDRTICSTKVLDLRQAPRILPGNVNGTYTTSGDGVFLDADGNELTVPFRYDVVAGYRPGPEDVDAGAVTLTLVTDDAGLCPSLTATIQVTVLEVDCGAFFWDGN